MAINWPRAQVSEGELTPDMVASAIEVQASIASGWGPFIGNVTTMDNQGKWHNPPSGVKPVNKWLQDPFFSGHSSIITTSLDKLIGSGTMGDETLTGKEETQSLKVGEILVNQRRHAVAKKAGFTNEMLGGTINARVVEKIMPQLRLWYAEELDFHIMTLALLEGYSEHITHGPPYGLNITKRYHPNIWTAGNAADDFELWSGVSADYETTIAAGLANLNGAAATLMSATLIEKLAEIMWLRDIHPNIMIAGKPFRWLIVHPKVYSQLADDPKILASNQSAWSTHKEELPSVTGDVLLYRGFMITSNAQIATEVHRVSASEILYGPIDAAGNRRNIHISSEWESELVADRHLYTSVILGNDAVNYGLYGRPSFATETRDYESNEGTGFRAMPGAARIDFTNRPQRYEDPTSVRTQGSMIIHSYA